MSKLLFAAAAMLVAGMASLVGAANTKDATPQKGAAPVASPGWVVVEEDWWYPYRYEFLDSLQRASVYHRAQEEKGASAEIDKAISWLRFAENNGDLSTKEALATARADLMDFSAKLRSGTPVMATQLDTAFAHASAALARHHYCMANKSLAESHLKIAGQHLMAASDHLRAAARSANYEYGDAIVSIYDDYAPYGHWDETIVLDKSKFASNLNAVDSELEKLATELKARESSRRSSH